MAKTDLTPGYLHQLFSYDPHDGFLRWKVRRSNVIHVGKVAGHTTPIGYRDIKIDGGMYKVHRIIWAMMTGAWPKEEIDHINHIPSDNRFSNLREASGSFNCQNRCGPRKDNKLGILGVHKRGTRFKASIGCHGKKIHLGSFPTPELAYAAYLEAKRKLHPGNTL